MELRTPLCQELGIEYPVFSVGFGTGARAALAAAVSNAGGFGVLGASGMQPDAIREEVARTLTLTDRPFGINVIIAEDPAADAEEDRRFILEQIRAAGRRIAAVVRFWGDPAPYVETAHANAVSVPMWAGESCSVVNDVKPAGEIVRELARDAVTARQSDWRPGLARPPRR